MPVVSSIFLVLSLVMAVLIGPQTRSWSWGPALLPLGLSLLAACPTWWKRGKSPADTGIIAFGTLVAGWFACRAWLSPVAGLAQADLLLITAAVGAFISVRTIVGNAAAERILIWGIALLLLANVLVAGKQLMDPTFTPIFRERAIQGAVTGFFAHYNETANFFIVTSMLVGASAVFGRHHAAARVLLLLIAGAGLAGVWFTRSRGGIFGEAVACGVFAAVSLMIGKKRKARWFAPALIALPVMGMMVGAYLFIGWQNAQEARRHNSGIEEIFDNNSRLYMLGMAMSCITRHPVTGGGSRSFSWECFQFADGKTQGDIITHKPEQVHNELVQAATDYGLLGAGLLTGLLGGLAVLAVIRILFDETESGDDDGWRLGALAGLAGMFVQSCFSFVFHLIPGVLFLGICLGQLARTRPLAGSHPQKTGSAIFLTLAAGTCCLFLIPLGWNGIRVTQALWPTYFSKIPQTSAESKIDALSKAIGIWPQSGFHQERAAAYEELAASGGEKDRQQAMQTALDDYQQAAALHPYDPAIALNRANLLSRMQRDPEAEEAYALGLRLQGGMEPGFRGHFSLAGHFLRKGMRKAQQEESAQALVSLELAAQEIETALKQMHWMTPDMLEPRLVIHESLGAAREATGDREGALRSYDLAITFQNGNRVHYRAGILIGKTAAEEWNARRPSEALGHFIKARQHIAATTDLPQGVTPGQRTEYLSYLDQRITYLKGARIEPAPEK